MHKLAAITICLAAACGSTPGRPDAEPPVVIDAEEPDASPIGQITVRTYTRCCANPGEVVGGIDIIAIDPDGTVNTAVTDAAGEARLTIYTGATVTALYREVMGGTLFTIMNVEPGDVLQFGEKFAATGTSQGTMTVNFPSVAQTYRVFHPCSSGSASATNPATSATFTVFDTCAGTGDLLLLGFDMMGNLTRFGGIPNATVVAGGSATLASWSTSTSFTMTFNNVPDGLNVAAQIQGVLNGREAYFDYQPMGTPVGGTYAFTRPWFSVGDYIIGGARFDNATLNAMQFFSEQIPTNTTQWVIDQPITLPWLTANSFDAATRTATVELDGTGAHDGIVVSIDYSHMSNNYSWGILAPPGQAGTNTIVFPDLPATLDAFEPAPADSVGLDVKVWDYSQSNGFDEARNLPEPVLVDYQGNLLVEGTRVSIISFL